MKKLITILLFCSKAFAQETIHAEFNCEVQGDYFVQLHTDSSWRTVYTFTNVQRGFHQADFAFMQGLYRIEGCGDSTGVFPVYPFEFSASAYVDTRINLSIQSMKNEPCLVSVYNISGQWLSTQKIFLDKGTNHIQINKPNASGVYVIRIATAQQAQSMKIYNDGAN